MNIIFVNQLISTFAEDFFVRNKAAHQLSGELVFMVCEVLQCTKDIGKSAFHIHCTPAVDLITYFSRFKGVGIPVL